MSVKGCSSKDTIKSIFLYFILIIFSLGCNKKKEVFFHEKETKEEIIEFLVIDEDFQLKGKSAKRKRDKIEIKDVSLKYKELEVLKSNLADYYQRKNKIRLYKSVTLNWLNIEIKAEEVIVYFKEGYVLCKKNVRLKKKNLELITNSLRIDLKDYVLESSEPVKISLKFSL